MIEDFIGVFDDVIEPSYCENFIEEFSMLEKEALECTAVNTECNPFLKDLNL